MRPYLTMSQEQATALLRVHATAIATTLGVDARQTEKLIVCLACENNRGELATDGRFYAQGSWLMPLASHEHTTTLLRLHDAWVEQGYTIKKFELLAENRGVLIAENPADEVELLVESGVPPIAFAVLIMTACYRPPD